LTSLPLTYVFFNVTATTEIYTLSLHDALPICFQLLIPPGGDAPGASVACEGINNFRQVVCGVSDAAGNTRAFIGTPDADECPGIDRKSTRLNSSHDQISYAVFCLKKKNKRNDL